MREIYKIILSPHQRVQKIFISLEENIADTQMSLTSTTLYIILYCSTDSNSIRGEQL